MRYDRCLLAVGLAAILAGCSGPDQTSDDGDRQTVRIGVVLPDGSAGAGFEQGADLGAAEAMQAGALVDIPVAVNIVTAGDAAGAGEAGRRLARDGVFAVVGGWATDVCRELSAVADDEGILFLDIGCRDDSLREAPSAGTFHIEASDWMYRQAADGAAGADSRVVLWHPDLFRYGAEQLNRRFEDRFGAPPAQGAWAAWMAIKVLWQSAVRLQSTDPDRIAEYLLDESTTFDGHKGQALVFGADDHQLRQPLYRPAEIGGVSVPVEVDPVSGYAAAMGAEEWSALEGVPVPSGRYAVVSNEGSGDVVVIDDVTGELVSRVRVGARPRGIHVSADGRYVYVAISDDAPEVETDEDGIEVIDLRQGRVIDHYPAGSDPEQFAITPDGRYLVAANEDAGTATVTDMTRGEVLATLTVGIEPEGVAASPDGRWVYVTAETSNTVSVIDVEKRTIVASFLVDVRPRATTFSPSRPRAYVTNEIGRALTVIDTDRHAVVGSLEFPDPAATPVGVVASPTGDRIYVANGHANSVSIIDADALELIAEVPVGERPWGIAISADGGHIYTANGLTNDVSVIDAETLEVIRTIPVGRRPWGVAVTAGNRE